MTPHGGKKMKKALKSIKNQELRNQEEWEVWGELKIIVYLLKEIPNQHYSPDLLIASGISALIETHHSISNITLKCQLQGIVHISLEC